MGWLWNRPARPAAAPPTHDRHGDPLPPGAVGRLGTTRLQHVVDCGNEGISGLAYSPDGNALAAAGRDGRVSVWDAATGRLVRMLDRHDEEPTCLAFAPDGRRLVSADRGGQVILWDVATGRQLYQVTGDTIDVYAVAFSPRGDVWAAAGFSGAVTLFDAAGGHEVLKLCGREPAEDGEEPEHFHAIAFSPDGARLAAASAYSFRAEEIDEDKLGAFMFDTPFDCGMVAMNPEYFANMMQEKAHEMMKAMQDQFGEEVMQKGMGFTFGGDAFGPRGWRVGEEGRLTVWRLPDGRREVSWDLEEGAPHLLAFSADGAVLASVGRAVHAWDVARKRRLAPDQTPTRWQPVPGFSPHGLTVVAPADLRTPARLWDTVRNREVRPLDPAQSWGPFAFAPGGDRLAVTGGRDTVQILDPATGQDVLPLPRHPWMIDAVAPSADAGIIAVTSGGAAHVWDRAADRPPQVVPGAMRLPAVSPDGTKLAAVTVSAPGGEAVVVAWDWRTGKRLVELEGLEPTGLLFPDDGTLLIGNALGQVGRYDLKAQKWQKVLRGPDGAVVVIAAGGRFVAAVGEDRILRLWQPDGTTVGEITLPDRDEEADHEIQQLALSPDGGFLGWASTTGQFHLWDVSTGKPRGRLRLPHPLYAAAVGFGPGGRAFAAGSTAVTDDSTEYQLRVWDLAAGKPVFATPPQPYPIGPLTFAPDRPLLAAASADRTVLLWDTTKW